MHRSYLSGVEVWDADGNFVTTEDGLESELHLSIMAELKHQLGNYDAPGKARSRSPTVATSF